MTEIKRNVEEELQGCQACLEEEAAADGEARARFGESWRPNPSATLARPFWEKLTSYR